MLFRYFSCWSAVLSPQLRRLAAPPIAKPRPCNCQGATPAAKPGQAALSDDRRHPEHLADSATSSDGGRIATGPDQRYRVEDLAFRTLERMIATWTWSSPIDDGSARHRRPGQLALIQERM